MNVLELFAGIGGMALGLERAGMHAVGFVETNPWCRRVLARHWPEVPQHDDVRTATVWWLGEDRPRVDVVSGGYPCQPESLAGHGRSTRDERWLWPDMARVIHAVRPRYVIGENVLGHRTRGLRFVLRDLERLGYTARAGVVEAREVGAPHIRKRIVTLAERADLANADEERRRGRARVVGAEGRNEPAYGGRGDSEQVPADGGWWATEPDVGRVAHGVPAGVDRLRGLGNAVVPKVAEHMGRLLISGQWRQIED